MSELLPLNQSQQEFCAALKAARERRGLKLTDIAAVTKVCPSYFSALERNDLRVWPKGLFRRSFFRGYASTVGLPVEPLLEEFMRLFPEDERAAAAPVPESEAEPARLILDESWHGVKVPVAWRFVVAAADAVAIAIPCVAVTLLQPVPLVLAFAVTALGYFTLATLLLGETPATFCLHRRERIIRLARTWLVPATSAATTQSEPAEARPWFSDARRTRPRSQAPGLRVRFKVSS